jgi:two-component system sensor histidine kinase MprB
MLVELAAADDAQRAFVADASHELRTPLTTVRTNVQLLTADRPLRPETRAALSAALGEEVAAMTRIVDDLVELAGDDRPRTAELVVEDVVAAVREAVAATSRRARGVEVRTDLPDAPVGVRVPPGRLGRLLDVVLDNAVKYGAGGAVEVRVVSGTPGDGVVVVTVSDHGMGIPADERKRVFDRFHRAPAARGLPGSGLGLAIAAQVVARAGGTITAEARSDGGAGTTIRLVLRAG